MLGLEKIPGGTFSKTQPVSKDFSTEIEILDTLPSGALPRRYQPSTRFSGLFKRPAHL